MHLASFAKTRRFLSNTPRGSARKLAIANCKTCFGRARHGNSLGLWPDLTTRRKALSRDQQCKSISTQPVSTPSVLTTSCKRVNLA